MRCVNAHRCVLDNKLGAILLNKQWDGLQIQVVQFSVLKHSQTVTRFIFKPGTARKHVCFIFWFRFRYLWNLPTVDVTIIKYLLQVTIVIASLCYKSTISSPSSWRLLGYCCGWYSTKRPMHCCRFLVYCASPSEFYHSWLIYHSSLANIGRETY
jgi:hypothetical protein